LLGDTAPLFSMPYMNRDPEPVDTINPAFSPRNSAAFRFPSFLKKIAPAAASRHRLRPTSQTLKRIYRFWRKSAPTSANSKSGVAKKPAINPSPSLLRNLSARKEERDLATEPSRKTSSPRLPTIPADYFFTQLRVLAFREPSRLPPPVEAPSLRLSSSQALLSLRANRSHHT